MDPVTEVSITTDDVSIAVQPSDDVSTIIVEWGEGQIEEVVAATEDVLEVDVTATNIADTILIQETPTPVVIELPWGAITGLLADQTDLQIALDAKEGLLGYTPEDVINKRTAWQVVPDYTHYPSEKLVKDALDAQGARNQVLHGSGVPAPGLGIDGDFYIDITAVAIYGPKTAGAWGSPTSLVGTPGTPGADGATWYSGSGVPSSGLGANGDFYFRTDTADVYEKATGTWSVIANLAGPAGTPGTVWRSGTGAPSSGLGVNGDFYYRTDTNQIYLKAAGSYSVIASLISAPGLGIVSYLWLSESPVSTGTHKRFYADRNGTIIWCRGEVENGDGVATANFDVKLNGTSIYPSATKPSVSAGQFVGATRAPNTTSFVVGDYFEVVVVDTGGTQGRLKLAINFSYAGI